MPRKHRFDEFALVTRSPNRRRRTFKTLEELRAALRETLSPEVVSEDALTLLTSFDAEDAVDGYSTRRLGDVSTSARVLRERFELRVTGARNETRNFDTLDELAEAVGDILTDGEVEDGVLDYLTAFDKEYDATGVIERTFRDITTRAVAMK